MTEKGFTPNWASPPGETIADILKERKLHLSKFARQLGMPNDAIQNLLVGRLTMTLETALKLEKTLGSTAAFWMVRESQYRQDLRRIGHDNSVIDERLWLQQMPVREMKRLGWLSTRSSETEKEACLEFFGVPDVPTWSSVYGDLLRRAAYKTSPTFKSSTGALAAWLRKGYLESQALSLQPWNAQRFREELLTIRSLSRRKCPQDFIGELQKRCARCGVAVVVVRAPAGCKANGATYFPSPSTALLILSVRHLFEDHFWFSFFHEAGHLLLHGKKSLFVEDETVEGAREELEANAFAARTLIPDELSDDFRALRANLYEIARFARRAEISPGIVVGQLQHEGKLKRNHFVGLKRRYSWQGIAS
jgi:HTH-type transcriptional regulator / antitoxin HigA